MRRDSSRRRLNTSFLLAGLCSLLFLSAIVLEWRFYASSGQPAQRVSDSGTLDTDAISSQALGRRLNLPQDSSADFTLTRADTAESLVAVLPPPAESELRFPPPVPPTIFPPPGPAVTSSESGQLSHERTMADPAIILFCFNRYQATLTTGKARCKTPCADAAMQQPSSEMAPFSFACPEPFANSTAQLAYLRTCGQPAHAALHSRPCIYLPLQPTCLCSLQSQTMLLQA